MAERRPGGWVLVLALAGLGGCAPKAFVRHEVRSEMRQQKESVEALREDVTQDAARTAQSAAALEQSVTRLTGEVQALRTELAAVRQLLATGQLETRGELDRVRLDVARLSATVNAATDRAEAIDAAVRRTLFAQKAALDAAVQDLSRPAPTGP
ncbi:MAG: 50S ribosomal protein L29 [Planctomycetes bacterium]|nr:50S ribosomal protein L29 [Planctomycetota bacterium]